MTDGYPMWAWWFRKLRLPVEGAAKTGRGKWKFCCSAGMMTSGREERFQAIVGGSRMSEMG